MEIFRKLARLLGGPRDEKSEQPSPPPNWHQRPELEDLSRRTEAEQIVYQICAETIGLDDLWLPIKLTNSATWQDMKKQTAELQVAVTMASIDIRPAGSMSYSGKAMQVQEVRKQIVSQTLRRNLPFTPAQLTELLTAWRAQPYSLEYGLPGKAMLGAVERLAETGPLDKALVAVLNKLRTRAQEGNYAGATPNKFSMQVVDKITKLLDPTMAHEQSLPAGPFADDFAAWLATLAEETRAAWLALALLASDAGDKAKPAAKWIAAAGAAMDGIGRAVVGERISLLLATTVPDPARPDSSLDILKGLIWMVPQIGAGNFVDRANLVGEVGRFAETCFRKISGIGARSVKLGNAALWALSEMAEEARAAAELFRLKEKIKYPSARKLIDTRLDALATKTGQSVAQMEDVSLPDFGLDAQARITFTFGQARCVVSVGVTETTQAWFNAAGKAVKSVPAEVKAEHGAALTVFRQTAKDIEGARAAQVLRLEQSWIEARQWAFTDWKAGYWDHPLRRPVVEALIWCIDDAVVMADGDTLRTQTGEAVALNPEARVRLWHPLDSTPTEVLAWRAKIIERGLTQPIKQAHREIYVLTDAERTTRTYSNRFAAHILRQHQFRALCQARGWQYDLMGGWDNWNMPTRMLPAQGMKVEYHVDIVEDGQRSDAYVSMHLASDQVRFLDSRGQALELEGIAPVLFSEVLRDVDLFVAVTSVANDPGWTDGGPDGRHGNYWREWAFGDLGQSAATRRELIGWIVPRLSIADRLEMGEKSLIVQGKRQQYAIHFGSGNIQILPDNRYLCIVPNGAPREAAGIKLPFAGDGTLSTILAKAFLLVDEDKITDVTILRQL